MRRVAHWALPIGTTAIVLAVGIFHATVRDGRYRFGEQNPLWAYVLFSGLLVIAAVSLGIPDEPRYIQHAFATATAAAFLGTSMVAFVSLIRPGILPRFVIIATPALTAPWFVACCGISRGARRRQRRRDRVLAVLSAEEAATLRDDAVNEFPRPELAFTLAAILDVEDLAKDPTQRLLIETAGDQDATLIVLSEEAQRIDSIVAQAAVLHEAGLRVRSLEMLYDGWFAKLPLSSLSRMALMSDIGDLHRSGYSQLKRLFDIAIGVMMLAALVAILPIIWIGNLMANRGPLLFGQLRVGRGGRDVRVWKLRTMTPSTIGSTWTAPHDPRITRFGAILRRLHLDELPQSWNLLCGDLSFVGPRPEQVHYVSELREKLPFYDLRHSVQPGMTGWAQVKFRYAASEADAFEKLQYDLYYLRHQSLTLDLRIVSRTVRSVALGHGR